MKLRIAIAATLLAGGALLPGAAALAAGAAASGTLVVANHAGGSVSLFDLETNFEIARLPIGPRFPHEIAVSPDGRYAAVGEYGGNEDPGRHVVVIDVVHARIAARIDLGPDSRPHSFAFLPDSERLVATMERLDRIALVDVAGAAVLRTYPTGGREGHMVRLSPDGAFAYVTSRGAEGTLSIVSLREDVPPVVIRTGQGAEGLAVSPDGTEVWVVNRAAGTISVVNTTTRAVVATLPARAGAGRAEISAGGRVLVPNGTSARATERFLSVYDLARRRLVAERALGTAGGDGPAAFGVLIVGEHAFVADRAERSLKVYALADLSLERTVATGGPDPDGVGWTPLRVAALEAQ